MLWYESQEVTYIYTHLCQTIILMIWLLFWCCYSLAAKIDSRPSEEAWFIAKVQLDYRSHLTACPGCAGQLLEVHHLSSSPWLAKLSLLLLLSSPEWSSNLGCKLADGSTGHIPTSGMQPISANHWASAMVFRGISMPSYHGCPIDVLSKGFPCWVLLCTGWEMDFQDGLSSPVLLKYHDVGSWNN